MSEDQPCFSPVDSLHFALSKADFHEAALTLATQEDPHRLYFLICVWGEISELGRVFLGFVLFLTHEAELEISF